MKRLMQISLILAVFIAGSAFAQSRVAGQVDLKPVQDAMGVLPDVNLNFGNAIIRGFAESMRGSNDNLADLLDSMLGLRVMVYKEAEHELVLPIYDETLNQLAFEGWTAAIEVRDDKNWVDVYIKESGEFVDGVMIMVNGQNDGGTIFINLYGALDPVFIGQVISRGVDFSDLDLDQFMEFGE